MALNPLQQLGADVLALRIVLGQLIVRIAAGSKDPAAVLKVMRESAVDTAARAQLRDMPEATQEELRAHLKGSVDRFFAAMRIDAKAGPASGKKPDKASPAKK